MLLVDPPRPATGEFVLEGFRLTEARKRIPLYISDQADDPQRLRTVLFNPPSQILEGR